MKSGIKKGSIKMNFKNINNFYVIETVSNDGQYLCEYLTNEDTRETHIHGTTRNIHDSRVKRFESLEKAEGICNGLHGDKYAENPRVLKVKVELSIEEA